MQDRFKFRYVLDNEICEVLAFDISDGIEHKCLFLQLKDGTRKIINDYVWSKFKQCTGLKDKNGKLIYEGDIVEVINCRGANAVVEYNLEEAKFILKGEKFAPSALQHIRKDYFEVIGNIYENPELLEVKC